MALNELNNVARNIHWHIWKVPAPKIKALMLLISVKAFYLLTELHCVLAKGKLRTLAELEKINKLSVAKKKTV